MARQRKNKGADVASSLIGFGFILAFIYKEQLEAILKVGLVLLICGSAIVVLIAYLRRNPRTPRLSSIDTPSTLRVRTTSSIPKHPDPAITSQEKPVGNVSLKPTEWSLDLIRSLDWKRFEELCAAYFQAKGRNAKVTNIGADGGIDVLLYGDSDPEKILGVVQCKAWTQKAVGVKEIRELLGIMTDVGCPLGVYVATSGYTPDAEAFAEGKHIKLISAAQLLLSIQQLPPDVQSKLLEETTAGDYTTPSCPSCGIKLVTKTAQRGKNPGRKFWGCSNYPRCRYMMPVRSTS